MADITIVNGVYKPTYNWGAPSCMIIIIISQEKKSITAISEVTMFTTLAEFLKKKHGEEGKIGSESLPLYVLLGIYLGKL